MIRFVLKNLICPILGKPYSAVVSTPVDWVMNLSFSTEAFNSNFYEVHCGRCGGTHEIKISQRVVIDD